MKVSMLCFSQAGWETGVRLADGLRAQSDDREVSLEGKSRYLKNSISDSHTEWTRRQFEGTTAGVQASECEKVLRDSGLNEKPADAIIFIGACGIAVRSIAPFIVSKKTDPAVLVVDEQGKFVISLLSGHLGGANELAQEAANLLGAIPVITTATDLNQRFAVDVFAKKNHCELRPMKAAKEVSAALLAGETVGFYSDYPWDGEVPEGLVLCSETGMVCGNELVEQVKKQIVVSSEKELKQTAVSSEKESKQTVAGTQKLTVFPRIGIAVSIRKDCHPFPVTLHIIPRIVTLGLGCRKDKEPEKVKEMTEYCLEGKRKVSGDTSEKNDGSMGNLGGIPKWHKNPIYREALEGIASIDLKKEEAGILALAEEWKLPFRTFSAEKLQAVTGDFSESAFVSSITGVDNVCERSAVLASEQGTLLRKKVGAEGVTTALAQREWRIRFE